MLSVLCLRPAVPNLNFLIKFNSLRSLAAYYYGKCRSVGALNLELQSSCVVRPEVFFIGVRRPSSIIPTWRARDRRRGRSAFRQDVRPTRSRGFRFLSPAQSYARWSRCWDEERMALLRRGVFSRVQSPETPLMSLEKYWEGLKHRW